MVFVFRNVSVESATRQKEGKHIREIDCFLLFPKIQRKQNTSHASGWGKATVHLRASAWSKDLVFHRSNIFLEKVKYFLFFSE